MLAGEGKKSVKACMDKAPVPLIYMVKGQFAKKGPMSSRDMVRR
jgi:hypothetical protein